MLRNHEEPNFLFSKLSTNCLGSNKKENIFSIDKNEMLTKTGTCTECQSRIYSSTRPYVCTCHSDKDHVFCSKNCFVAHRGGTDKPFCLCVTCRYDGTCLAPLDWHCFICSHHPVRANDESAIHVTKEHSFVWDMRFSLKNRARDIENYETTNMENYDNQNSPKWMLLWNNLVIEEKDLLINESDLSRFYKGHLKEVPVGTINTVLCKDCMNDHYDAKQNDSEEEFNIEKYLSKKFKQWDVYRLLFDVEMIDLIKKIEEDSKVTNEDDEKNDDEEDEWENEVEYCLALSNSNLILSNEKRVKAMVETLPLHIQLKFYNMLSSEQAEYHLPLQSLFLTMTNLSNILIEIIIIYSSPCARNHLIESLKDYCSNKVDKNINKKIKRS